MRPVVLVVKIALLCALLPSFRFTLVRSRPTKVRKKSLHASLLDRTLSELFSALQFVLWCTMIRTCEQFLVWVSFVICVCWAHLGPFHGTIIPWGHSGPVCHALSLSSLASWTSMCRRRATVQWRHLVNWREAARCGEWAQHFSYASCFSQVVGS